MDPLYIGTKVIHARPMSRQEYLDYRGWSLPADENPEDRGYLVEYTDGGKPNHPDHGGYISWSPKEQFDNAYRPCVGMDIGQAVTAMRAGHRVARAGWNGKGMFLYFVPAASYPAGRNTLGTMKGIFPDDLVPYGAYVAMKTAQDNVVPWLASQTDLLATDWVILD